MNHYEERRPRVSAVIYGPDNHDAVVALLLENDFTEVNVRYTDAAPWVDAKGEGLGLVFTYDDVLVQPTVYNSGRHGWMASGPITVMSNSAFRDAYERA